MSWPVGMPLVTITAGVYRSAAAGGAPLPDVRVELEPSVKTLVWNGETIMCGRIEIPIVNGAGQVDVPPVDHPDIAPQNWFYTVREFVGLRTLRRAWTFKPTLTGGVVDLDTAAPVAVSPDGQMLAAGPAGKDGTVWGGRLSGGMNEGVPFIQVDFSPWGLDGSNNAYYDEAGAPEGERALPHVEANGDVTLVKLTGVVS